MVQDEDTIKSNFILVLELFISFSCQQTAEIRIRMEPYTKGNIDQLSFSTRGKYEDIYMILLFFF